jgi:hypothetical protein
MISFFDGVHLNDRIEDSAATRNIACRKRERMLRQLCSWDCKAAGKPAIGARRSKD